MPPAQPCARLPDAIDMAGCRVEAQAAMAIALPDADAAIGPVPTSGGGFRAGREPGLRINLLETFNERNGRLFER